MLVEVSGSMLGYVEIHHGSFRGIYSWKPQLMEAMEASSPTDSGNFHAPLWKLPLASMGVT